MNHFSDFSSNRNSPALPENEEAVLRTFDFLEEDAKSDDKTNPIASADAEAPWNDDKPTPGVGILLDILPSMTFLCLC